MDYLDFKALHIIFVVTWFAGLFYLVRLYIYHYEAMEKSLPAKKELIEQFTIMERRLWYGITWPSCILTSIFGGIMILEFLPLNDSPWLIVKLVFVVFLFLYHLSLGQIYKNLLAGKYNLSSNKLRIYNEVATIFLFAIVFLVVKKETLSFVSAIVGLLLLGLVMMLAIRLYRTLRLKKNHSA